MLFSLGAMAPHLAPESYIAQRPRCSHNVMLRALPGNRFDDGAGAPASIGPCRKTPDTRKASGKVEDNTPHHLLDQPSDISAGASRKPRGPDTRTILATRGSLCGPNLEFTCSGKNGPY